MRQIIINFVKGLVIGIGKIIPGVSGAMIAISLGVYEEGLHSISKPTKQGIKFLINIGIGILISIVLFSNIVIYLLDNHYLPTMLLFIGLIIGGNKEISKEANLKKKTNVIFFIISLFILLMISKLNGNRTIIFEINFSNYIMLVISGIIDAFATVVPGISGTALLMIFGYYNVIISSIGNIFGIGNILSNIFVLSAYSIGMLMGILFFSKIISYFFQKYRQQTYSSIFGFSISTIIILFIKTFSVKASPTEIIFSLILLILGYLLSRKFAK